GLLAPNIHSGGLIASKALVQHLRDNADVLVVPMSFHGHDANMRLSFPSKLTDYTAAGLPILICGPEYCSAVRWARENAPVAEVVTSPSPELLGEAIGRLASREHRLH